MQKLLIRTATADSEKLWRKEQMYKIRERSNEVFMYKGYSWFPGMWGCYQHTAWLLKQITMETQPQTIRIGS